MTAEIYTHLTHQPGYRPELDIVVEGPDGAFVACCNIWLDEENGAGEFEPVSVHPDHRRKGISHAMILFGLRQMQRHGMRLACVTSWHENLPARRLYETCGLPIARCEYRYKKTLPTGDEN